MPDELESEEHIDHKTATEISEELTSALRENTEALNKLIRRYQVSRVVLILLVIYAFFSGFLFWGIRDAQYDSCQADNRVRQGLLNLADFIANNLDNDPVTEEVVHQLRNDFALKGC